MSEAVIAQTPQAKAIAERPLFPKQERFCWLYILDPELNGNATRCYMEAYGTTDENVAAVNASILIRKPKVAKRLNQLLEAKGFNDHWIDNRLMQLAEDSSNKRAAIDAIKEMNRLKGRITERKQIAHVDINQLIEQTRGAKPVQEQGGYAS